MNDILQSVDDLSVLKISKRIKSIDNEKNLFKMDRKITKLIDSQIMTEMEMKIIEEDMKTIKSEHQIHVLDDKCIEGQHWNRNDKGQWIPHLPPEPAEDTPSIIMKSNTHQEHNDSQMQTDSGANRIVTDDLSLLTK